MKQIILVIAACCSLLYSCSSDELHEYPSSSSTDAEISSFSLLDEDGNNATTSIVIDEETKQVLVSLKSGVDKTKLFPRSNVSEGVIIEPRMGVYTDFTNSKEYTLIAGDRITKVVWTIIIE